MHKNQYKCIQLKKAIMLLSFSVIGAEQAVAAFIDDSSTSLNFRNFYSEREFEGNRPDTGSWSQSITGLFESGYIDTSIQVGLNFRTQYAFRLNNRNVTTDDAIFLYDVVEGKQKKDQFKVGATLKLKYSDTELKIGELLPVTPVAVVDYSRQLITTYAGIMLESREISNLNVTAGRITHINARNDDSYEKLGLFTGKTRAKFESDGLNFFGVDYNLDSKTSGSYWFGQLEDVYQQHYANLAYTTKVSNMKVKLDARYFNFSDEGDALYGDIDSQSYGVMTTIEDGNHLLMTGIRKNEGKSVFPTLSGYVPQTFLHSWSNLGFIKPNELTWHILYSYDFKDLGVAGLRATVRYINGSEIYRVGLEDNSEIEKSVALKYVVPEGKLKGLGLEFMHIRTDIKYGSAYEKGTAFNENRVIGTYTYKF